MGWDSNPRKGLTFGGFQDRCIKPLCHPSGDLQAQWRAGENSSACIARVQVFFVACRGKEGVSALRAERISACAERISPDGERISAGAERISQTVSARF